MGKIFCLMGKSGSGKDTIFEHLLKDETLHLKPIILYTTRPMRESEVNGKTYHFITEKELKAYKDTGKVIEERMYNTVYGPWYYATIDDGTICTRERNYYIMIVTLEGYNQLVDYFGQAVIEPIYIEVEDGERLKRAINRESIELKPKYEELCRRFLADSKDFSREKLEEAHIETYYNNDVLEKCLHQVKHKIADIINR